MGSAPTKLGRNGDQMREKFVFSYVIGKGGFGKVYSALHVDSKEWFAIKETNIHHILQHKNGFSLLMSEVQALKRVGRHPCIVALNSAFHDSRFCYMALDLCTGGDLRYHMKRQAQFTEKQIAFIVACVGSALHHCHSKGVLHRDVKPENILIDEHGYAMLTDFGVSFSSDSFLSHPSKDVVCTMASGTRQYLAPEVFTPSHKHGCASDFWSLGIVAFELLYGQRPFNSHCPMQFIQYAAKHLHTRSGGDSAKAENQMCSACVVRGEHALFVDQGCQFQCLAPGVSKSDLMVMCPEMSRLVGYVSTACRRVLRGLFSVNQSRRWGHGEKNFQLLRNDNWFVECDVSWGDIDEAKARPQFRPNLREVSMDICHMYIQDDKVNELPSVCSTCDMTSVLSKKTVGGGVCLACGHRRRVLTSTRGVQEALRGFFFLADEYAEFDPALDEQWKVPKSLEPNNMHVNGGADGLVVQIGREDVSENTSLCSGSDDVSCSDLSSNVDSPAGSMRPLVRQKNPHELTTGQSAQDVKMCGVRAVDCGQLLKSPVWLSW